MYWDRGQSEPGRGAYLHPSWECCGKMVEPKMWERALRIAGRAVSEEGERGKASLTRRDCELVMRELAERLGIKDAGLAGGS